MKFYPDNDRPNPTSQERISLGVVVTRKVERVKDYTITTISGLPITMIPPQPKSKFQFTPIMYGTVIASCKQQRYVTCCITFSH